MQTWQVVWLFVLVSCVCLMLKIWLLATGWKAIKRLFREDDDGLANRALRHRSGVVDELRSVPGGLAAGREPPQSGQSGGKRQ
jgi:hypothetical protein